MLRRLAYSVSCHSCTSWSGVTTHQARSVMADKARAGMIVRMDKKYWRVVSNKRSQKGQMSVSFAVKMVQVGHPDKIKETVVPGSTELPDVRAQRHRLLFSGFDDEDYACFVFPEASNEAGREVNIPAKSLPDYQQKYLCVRMPVDVLQIPTESEEEEDFWGDITLPSSWTYTVEGLRTKGMYKLAQLEECDGEVSISDAVNVGAKIKVVIRPDGTASYAGRAN